MNGTVFTIVLVLVSLAAPALISSAFIQHLLVMSLIFTLFALGYNVQFGYSGLFNLGHAAFFGIGGYSSAYFATSYGLPYVAGLFIGLVISASIALAMGLLTLRTRGPQFAMMTLGLGQVLFLVAMNWAEVTRGPLGITGIPSPTLELGSFRLAFDDEVSYYYFALIHLIAVFLLLRAFLNSRLGSSWLCVRENEDLAAALGVDPRRAKITAFVFGSLVASVAGSLYAHYIHLVTPGMLSVHYMVIVLIMVVVGGQGTFYGPVLGALLFTVVPEALRFTDNMRMAVFGLLLLVFVLFLPNGLSPMISNLWKRLGETIGEWRAGARS
jgi:branched-chain amino acid transport system permease protein